MGRSTEFESNPLYTTTFMVDCPIADARIRQLRVNSGHMATRFPWSNWLDATCLHGRAPPPNWRGSH